MNPSPAEPKPEANAPDRTSSIGVSLLNSVWRRVDDLRAARFQSTGKIPSRSVILTEGVALVEAAEAQRRAETPKIPPATQPKRTPEIP